MNASLSLYQVNIIKFLFRAVFKTLYKAADTHLWKIYYTIERKHI